MRERLLKSTGENDQVLALVAKSTGSWYRLVLANGQQVEARVRGKLKMAGNKSTNPVAVGDRVVCEQAEGEWHIVSVQPRKNYIIRKATKLSSQWQVLAANLDLSLVVATLKQPELKLGFIDRLLATAEAYSIPATLVFNKVDLLDADERSYLNELGDAYAKCGYQLLPVSANTGEGVETLRQLVSGKLVAVNGHSGVGKSSLLKALNPALDVRVSNVSTYNEKGRHTTTFAELFAIGNNTFVVDTPGLRSFGLTAMEPEELKHFFPEMVALAPQCRFHNCHHLNEPGCAVKPAYENGLLPWFRYEHYGHLWAELKTDAAE